MSSAAPLPYSDVAASVLDVIYDSLRAIYKARFKNVPQKRLCSELRMIASRLPRQSWAKWSSRRVSNNPHILEGIASKRTLARLPRISALCLEAYARVQGATFEKQDDAAAVFLPSPLAILVDALTVPARPESGAYSFALARALLFSCLRIHPPSSNVPAGWEVISIADVQDFVESFRTYFEHRDNIHYTERQPAKTALAHFLGLLGVFRLRFGTAGKDRIASKRARSLCLKFLSDKEFLHGRTEEVKYEFRLNANLEDVPDAQELINLLMGIPLPIRGASTIFFGGLQKSHHDSLVISISGAAGTGKTSVALALAAALAPFGTQCLYCTFEEDPETLRRRVSGLTPQYFRRTTLPNSSNIDWFSPISLDAAEVDSVESFAERYLTVLTKRVARSSQPPAQHELELPAIAPLLVVVDSLTTLYGVEQQHTMEGFCKLVRYLRDLNCVVLLLSAEDVPKGSRLEYLVDSVISLRYEGTESAEKKPTRLLQLLKTRLQLSRPGSHILHLSGERGVRISPQLSSQLDAKKLREAPLPKRNCVIDTLYVDGAPSGERGRRLIDLYERSRTLIHGHGSSGKAPLALKPL